jgi:hypothetical protein
MHMTGHDVRTRIGLVASLALVSALAACGPADTALVAGVTGSALVEANGLSPNGLARNGLARNGLARNGLARNGLARNGLLSAEFQGWFDEDPATSAAVMTYLVRCAAPARQTYTFTSPSTGVTYRWSGSLGLAPGWATGLEATVAEEQIITACLAAHVNKYGREVVLSVLGQGATGVPVPTGKTELATYSQREGCFFGNLFADEGVSVGLDHEIWDRATSSARACAFDIFGIGPSADCPPIDNVGPCWLSCKRDPTDTYFTSCGRWVSGAWKSYLPITTRILPADVYQCGDGVCQFTEQCGTGTTAASCLADCGDCSATKIATDATTPTATKNTTRNRR